MEYYLCVPLPISNEPRDEAEIRHHGEKLTTVAGIDDTTKHGQILLGRRRTRANLRPASIWHREKDARREHLMLERPDHYDSLSEHPRDSPVQLGLFGAEYVHVEVMANVPRLGGVEWEAVGNVAYELGSHRYWSEI